MLIKLSSDTESDPTKFSNNFSEGMIIKPFSKVCLIKGQITRIDQGQKLNIQAGTIINVSIKSNSRYYIYYKGIL